ncbi:MULTISPECIES: OmpP1/FadL family transporter [unclassified Bacteroides]|uniref:OmpP1/FadL family transporter n=1 Tax=unclassified Bacteroides TaxID=2646097 RepID=UPI0040643EE2
MRKKIVMMAFATLATASVGAQSAYDATNIASHNLNGTARFVGMGGAMGALGGDISTIGTNPAGIGLYRSSDAMFSLSFSSIGTESKFRGQKFNKDENRWSFDNLGFVFSTKIGNQTALRYVNFAFNYKKQKSFYRTTIMAGQLGFSQTDLMSIQANDMFFNPYSPVDLLDLKKKNKNPYSDTRVGWLGALGFDADLVETDDDPKLPFYNRGYEPYANYRSRETGGIDQYDFNVAFNVKDRVYMGVTLGAHDVNYRKSYYYSEDNKTADERYNLSSENGIEGIGWDAKLGVIVRPFEESPLRFGLAIHTPTFYSLTYRTSAAIQSEIWHTDPATGKDYKLQKSFSTFYELNNKEMKREFDLRTPWKYNLSIGYTVGKSLAVGAEYEYEDFSTMKFYYPEGDKMEFETEQVKQTNKGVHTFRVGAEYKVIPQFALRMGYTNSSAAYRTDAVKVLSTNSINTDTDFANAKSLNNYTLGIGYRGASFYADLAYKYSTQKADLYPFGFSDERPTVTKVTDTRSQVLLTLGMRF